MSSPETDFRYGELLTRPLRFAGNALKLVPLMLVLPFSAASHAQETAPFKFPYPVPTNHLRIVSWNLKFFNDRGAKTSGAEPDRTPAQLDACATDQGVRCRRRRPAGD